MTKTTRRLIALISVTGLCLTLSTPSFASSAHSKHQARAGYSLTITPRTSETSGLERYLYNQNTMYKNKLIAGGSETASHYFRVGVNQYERGNFDKAERAFESVLRSNGLDKQAYYYLTLIIDKQGDASKMAQYAEAFHALER